MDDLGVLGWVSGCNALFGFAPRQPKLDLKLIPSGEVAGDKGWCDGVGKRHILPHVVGNH
jgi:hypothetical protein